MVLLTMEPVAPAAACANGGTSASPMIALYEEVDCDFDAMRFAKSQEAISDSTTSAIGVCLVECDYR